MLEPSVCEILVVEDSRTQRLVLVHLLRGAGFEVRACTNAEEALAAVAECSPNIVISDVMMPGIDGYELCRVLKGEHQDLPVILLTTLRESADILRGLECGADGFISKPLNPKALLGHIRHIRLNAELRRAASPEAGIEVYFGGKRHFLNSTRLQILNHLLSSYGDAVDRSAALTRANTELSALQDELSERNADLEAKNRELARLNDEKNQLFGMIAHDLRNPISIIYGFARLLGVSMPEESEERRMLERIEARTHFMGLLVDDLLQISAFESGKLSLRWEQVDIGELVEEVVDLHRVLARPRGIALALDRGPDLPALRADPGKLEQVLSNLLGNALKFSPPETMVKIAARRRPDGVAISVVDEGPGIPEADRARVFEPFAQRDSAETGVGLGLAIARRIVEGHGGTIKLLDHTASGAAFEVFLPDSSHLEASP